MSFQFTLNAIRFEDVRAEVVKFLTENGTYDAQFDFSGSNLSYVIDTMAYTTMLMSYMLSTVANDNFLDTTTLRKNAVSISKTLGYKPKRIQTSRIEGSFTYRPGDVIFGDESKITIPPATVFTGSDDGENWTNTEPIVLTVNPKDPFELTSAADPATPRISLQQGIWRQFNYLGNGKSLQSFVIPSTQIDENNMKVSVYITSDSEGESGKVEWTYAKTFFEIQSDEIYFVEEDIVNEGSPKIIFGNNIIGRAPSGAETVVVDYLETIGPRANNETDVEIPDTVVLNKSFDIISVDSSFLDFESAGPSFGGTEYETLELIQANAPRFFAAAGRAVTGNDYETLILNEFGYLVDALAVFGGDQLEPGNRDFLGNSYNAATPAAAELIDSFLDSLQIYLTESSETEIISSLKSAGVIATEKYFLKPSYIYLQEEVTIELSSGISSAERLALQIKAEDTLNTYFEEEFSGFGVPYRESKVRSQVDAITQVISTEIDTEYGFILNRDTFYTNQETRTWLPVRFARTDTGEIAKTDQGFPITTNFVKTNLQIARDYDSGNQSSLELWRITVDSENKTDVDRTIYVWHNRNPELDEDLDLYWAPSLAEGSYETRIDFNQAGYDTSGGEEFELTFLDNGVPLTAMYITTVNPTDGTSLAVQFEEGLDTVFTITRDTTDEAVLTFGYPRNFTVSSTTIAAPAFLDDGDSIPQVVEELPANHLTDLQYWTIWFNEEAVGQLFLQNDRTFTAEWFAAQETFIKDTVELDLDFDIREADPLLGIDYNSIRVTRSYLKSKGLALEPEEIKGLVQGKTSIHGQLTHPDLFRYLFNSDSATETVSELVVYTQSGNKSLFQEMFSFKGVGSNFYTTSLSWSNIDETGNNTYSLFFNNTLSDDRQKVATMIWDKSLSGIDQFQFITRDTEAAWLIEQGFFVEDVFDGTTTIYTAFTVTVDEKAVYSVDIQLASGVSAIKINEKNLLCAWTHDGTVYTTYDSYTREFTDADTAEQTPLILTDDEIGTLSVDWGDTPINLATVAVDATEFTGFLGTIIEDDKYRLFGLRTEIRIEPYPIITTNEVGDIVTIDGYGLFAYGVYHNSIIGTFEYSNGDTIYHRNIEGDFLGGNAEQETATSSIRDFFDNYGIGEDDIKMNVIIIVPDNEYEIDETETTVIVGKLTDFDSVFTQTIRADILPVESVLI